MGGKGSGGLHTTKARMREISPLCQTSSANVDPEKNAASIQHNMAVMQLGLQPLDYKDAEAVAERTYDYMRLCAENGRRPLVEGYCLALGISDDTARLWMAGARKNPKASPESIEVIRRYWQMLKAMYADNLTEEQKNPAKWIFYGKNHFGYTDEKRQVVIKESPIDQAATEEEVAAKYADVIGVGDGEYTPPA